LATTTDQSVTTGYAVASASANRVVNFGISRQFNDV
jgi:hypothetical protein